jgi:hypothetical protein
MEVILQTFSRLLAVLILAEIIVMTWRVNPEH